MKSGTVEFWIEVPIQIHYTPRPGERRTWEHPGHPVEFEIDHIEFPDGKKFNEIISKHTDEIKATCEEDLKE